MNSTTAEANGDAQPQVDGMLRDFFQSEMPRCWPRFVAPREKAPGSFWERASGRLALAACVALLVGGYLALSACFPPTTPNSGVTPLHHIGKKEPAKASNILKEPRSP